MLHELVAGQVSCCLAARGRLRLQDQTVWAGETRAWRIYKDHHDVWDDGSGGSTSAIIDVLGTVANHSRPYAWGDPDVLMTGGAGCDARLPGVRCPGMSPTEYRTEFAMWVMAAAPLLVHFNLLGDDKRAAMRAFGRWELLDGRAGELQQADIELMPPPPTPPPAAPLVEGQQTAAAAAEEEVVVDDRSIAEHADKILALLEA